MYQIKKVNKENKKVRNKENNRISRRRSKTKNN